MALCSLCENITINQIDVDADILAQQKSRPWDPSQRWEEPLGYDHHLNYTALLESAKSCQLCRLISEIAEQDGTFPKFDPKFDMIPDQIARRNASQQLKLRAFQQSPAASSSTTSYGQGSGVCVSNAQKLSIRLEIFADEDSAAALSGDIAGRPIQKTATYAMNFDMILSWMHNLLLTHRRCSPITSNSQQHNTTGLPTRVLVAKIYSGYSMYST